MKKIKENALKAKKESERLSKENEKSKTEIKALKAKSEEVESFNFALQREVRGWFQEMQGTAICTNNFWKTCFIIHYYDHQYFTVIVNSSIEDKKNPIPHSGCPKAGSRCHYTNMVSKLLFEYQNFYHVNVYQLHCSYYFL